MPASTPPPRSRFLEKMQKRLQATLASGPSLNCRPHQSRQRVDLALVAGLDGTPTNDLLSRVLGVGRAVKIVPRYTPLAKTASEPVSLPEPVSVEVTKEGSLETGSLEAPSPAFPRSVGEGVGLIDLSAPSVEGEENAVAEAEPPPPSPVSSEADAAPALREKTPLTEEEARAKEVEKLLGKLRHIADDARAYEQDTGAHVLVIGYPILSLPPGSKQKAAQSGTQKRVLAPVAFIPVALTVKPGRTPMVLLETAGEGADLVQPNTALLSWIEQQTRVKFDDLFVDEEGKDPWREIRELASKVATALELKEPVLGPERPLSKIPGADDDTNEPAILECAVLGLFPHSSLNLLRDVDALAAGEIPQGPIESFLRADLALAVAPKPGRC